MNSAPIRIASLDDHEFISAGVANLAGRFPTELNLVFQSTIPAVFEARMISRPPDIAIVDLLMDGQITGHKTIAALSKRNIRCIAFTADQRRVPIRLAMQAGARGLVLKGDGIDRLRDAILEVDRDGWASSSLMAESLLTESARLPTLSPQELRCLQLAGEGIPIKAIGRQFTPGISISSVRTYLVRAYEKYAEVGRAVTNTTAAVTQTSDDGWFDL